MFAASQSMFASLQILKFSLLRCTVFLQECQMFVCSFAFSNMYTVYVYIYIYLYLFIYLFMYLFIYVFIYLFIFIFLYIFLYLHDKYNDKQTIHIFIYPILQQKTLPKTPSFLCVPFKSNSGPTVPRFLFGSWRPWRAFGLPRLLGWAVDIDRLVGWYTFLAGKMSMFCLGFMKPKNLANFTWCQGYWKRKGIDPI